MSLPQSFVLCGATGDLAARMLLPSLYHLRREGLTDPAMPIVANGRSKLSREEFEQTALDALSKHVRPEHYDADAAHDFAKTITFVAGDSTKADCVSAMAKAAGIDKGRQANFYLSVAPSLYPRIVDAMGASGAITPSTRVALEKPIGVDYQSSIATNDALARVFTEEQTFRVDHYLGKETVQNLLALRFANAMFEPLWNAQSIAQVQVTIGETLGVEGRADYYDSMGALRDMMQNHLLQLVALIAMEPPSDMDPSSVRNEKVKVLRSLRRIGAEDVESKTVFGQYAAGAVDGKPAQSYRDDGGAPNAHTFVAVRAEIDNWRWAGTPFYLRTGKRLAERRTEIYIEFKQAPHNIFQSRDNANHGAHLSPNALVIHLQPGEGIELCMMVKEPGLDRDGVRLRQVGLDISLSEAFAEKRRRIAYERLLLDMFAGNQTLFVRRDEVEAAWAWVDGIAAGWQARGMNPKPYASGSWGPSASIALPERFGHSWHE
ncbi:MAG: glucose-6-phosphate dehydrogenase [Caulobacterales bacterium]